MKHLIQNWKREFESRQEQVRAFSKDVYGEIFIAKTQQLTLASHYSAKNVGAVTSYKDFFKADDSVAIGLANLSQGKPAVGEYFLLCGVSIQFGEASAATVAATKALAFGLIDTNMRNGEVEISQNKRTLVERMSMEAFFTADSIQAVGDTNAAAVTPITYTMTPYGNVGFIELATPKWITPQEKIEIEMDFSVVMSSANDNVKVILWGIKNVKG